VQRRARRPDTAAEDDRNQTRGLPRAGAALLHGRLEGGEGGPQLLGQANGGPLSLGHALRQRDGVPGGQHLAVAAALAARWDAA
jgi:hypothetical protein